MPVAATRTWLVTAPFEARALLRQQGAQWVPGTGWVYKGETFPFPPEWRPLQRSWEWHLERQLNGERTTAAAAPTSSTGSITLTDLQQQGRNSIVAAARAGAPEFILADDVGVGKTFTTIAAVNALPGVRRILVIAPLHVLEGWRQSLPLIGDGGREWCLINYESTKKLLTTPPSARAAKRQRTKNTRTVKDGKPKVAWDVVITDEAHHLSNPVSQQSQTVEKVINGPDGAPPAFVIRLSATAGENPAQLSYLHRGLAWRTHDTGLTGQDDKQFVNWCENHAIAVKENTRFGTLTWEGGDSDLKRMSLLMFGGRTPWGLRRAAPWGSPPRTLAPVRFTREESELYETEWGQFKQASERLLRAQRSQSATTKQLRDLRAKGLAALVRYRQKAGLLRVPYTVDFIVEAVKQGRQVCVSCEYTGTVEAIRDRLSQQGVDASVFTGANRASREQERLAFQQGRKPVILFTPVDGMNFQAGETASSATTAPRVTVVAEPRWTAKQVLQVEGRAHRNFQIAPVVYPYAVGTIERQVLSRALQRMADTKELMGESAEDIEALAVGMSLAAEEAPSDQDEEK